MFKNTINKIKKLNNFNFTLFLILISAAIKEIFYPSDKICYFVEICFKSNFINFFSRYFEFTNEIFEKIIQLILSSLIIYVLTFLLLIIIFQLKKLIFFKKIFIPINHLKTLKEIIFHLLKILFILFILSFLKTNLKDIFNLSFTKILYLHLQNILLFLQTAYYIHSLIKIKNILKSGFPKLKIEFAKLKTLL